MQEDIRHILALKSVVGIGDVLAKQLISYCGSAEAVFKESKGRLLKIPGVGQKVVEALQSKQCLASADLDLKNCQTSQVQVLPYYHVDYPDKLKSVNDAPLFIYLKGNMPYKSRRVVGIVGTRNATNYGKQVTEEIVKALMPYNVLVVSGLAYGIDIMAHRSAMKYGVPTIGVLAGGIDWVYPSVHKKTAEEMLESGALVSEQKPGTQPDAHLFPARNRIIAGMSEVVIVVEAAAKGGALITAEIAYSYDREVFAVPGNLGNQYSEGCNRLLRNQKASIYTDIEDVAYLMNWQIDAHPTAQRSPVVDMSTFSTVEQKLISVLGEFKNGLHIDELSWKSQISVNTVGSTLLNLEFQGLIRSLPGKIFQLKSGND